MANIPISGLPIALFPLDDPNTLFEVSVIEAGEEVSRRITLSDIAGATGLDATFLTLSANAQLPNERVLTEGTNISFVDTGPNGTLTINAAGVSFPILAPDGSAVAPSYSFTNDPGAGMFLNALGELSLAADGVEILRAINGANNQVAIAQSGSSSVPDLTSLADLDTGFRFPANNETVWIGGGSRSWNFSTAKFFSQFSNGPALMNEISSATNPTVVPDHSDPNTGLGHPPTGDELSGIAGGVEVWQAKEVGGDVQLIIDPGNTATLGAPALAFGDGDSGFRQPLDDNLQLVLAGVNRFFWELDSYNATAGTGPAMINAAAGATVVGFAPRRSDPNTGLGSAGSDELTEIAGGIEAVRWRADSGNIQQINQNQVGITASATQTQAGGFALNSSYNEVATVTIANDAVTAFNVVAGARLVIVNNGANNLQVFPAPSDDIGAGVDASIVIQPAEVAVFLGRDSTNWDTLYNGPTNPSFALPDPILLGNGSESAPSYSFASDIDCGMFREDTDRLGLTAGGVTAVLYQEGFGTGILAASNSDIGLTASVTQTQAGGLVLRSSYNEVSTVANSGDALTLQGQPNLTGTHSKHTVVINNGANDLQLFPALGDSIGNLAVNSSVTIEAGHVCVLLGRDSANWDLLFLGDPEVVGTSGATLTGKWQFDSNTTEADPGAGNFRNDNGTIGSVTEVFISSETEDGIDADNILSFLSSGDRLYIQNLQNAAEFMLFDITANVDNGGWFSIAGTVSNSGSNFTNGAEFGVVLLFGAPTGAGGTLPAGTIGDSSLKWDGISAWVEETQVAFPGGATGVKVFDATLADFITMGHNGTTAGFSVNAATTEVIFGQGGGPSVGWRFEEKVRFPDGSAAVPSIAFFTGGTDGFYRSVGPGVGTVVGGVEHFRVSNATTQVFSDDFRLNPNFGADLARMIVNGPSNLNDFEIELTSLIDFHVTGSTGERFVLEEFNLAMVEKSAAPGDVAGVGQFWVRDDVPNTAMFTNDTGVDKSLVNDAVQARRTTNYVLTTAFVDITLDTTDIETDSAVLDHDLGVNDDNIIIGQPGTYRISYEVDAEATTTGDSNIEMDGRVRLNDGGTGIAGSNSKVGVIEDGSIVGDIVAAKLSHTFYATLAAADFITLQLDKVEISGSETYEATSILLKAERVL